MCNINTCIHNKVSGQQALEAWLAAKHRKHVCDTRLRYLEGRVASYQEFIVRERGEDWDTLVHRTKKRLFSIWREGEGFVSDIQTDIMRGLDKFEVRADEEAACHLMYMAQLDQNCTKGISKWYQEQRLKSLHLEELGEEFLKRAQAEFDDEEKGGKENYLSKETWKVVKKFRERVKELRFKEHTFNYTQWAMLTNWANKLLANPTRYDTGDIDTWEEIAKQDMFLWSTKGDVEHDKALEKLEKEYISSHYADMSKVVVYIRKPGKFGLVPTDNPYHRNAYDEIWEKREAKASGEEREKVRQERKEWRQRLVHSWERRKAESARATMMNQEMSETWKQWKSAGYRIK